SPSPTDTYTLSLHDALPIYLPEFGEGALKNCLPYDEVPKARYTKWSDGHPLFVEELKRRSADRVQHDTEFHYVMEDMERLRHKLDRKSTRLNSSHVAISYAV